MGTMLALCCLAAFVACDRFSGTDKPPAEQHPLSNAHDLLETSADRPVIVAFGNSLTFGLGVPSNHAYPALLKEKLQREGFRYRVVNAGVNGETTAGALGRVDSILNHRPAIVILEFGANDGLRGFDLGETKANLKRIIERLRREEVKILLAGMQLPLNYGPRYSEKFSAMYSELAATYNVAFMPFFLKGVAMNPSLNQRDGIHPTGAGYAAIVEHLWPILLPLLE